MKVLVYIGGTNDGFWNAAGSEQRYLMGLAEMLAHYGHDVYCAGSEGSGEKPPSWGNHKPTPNVSMIHLSQLPNKKDFDLAIVSENFVHWRQNGQPIQTPCSYFDGIAKVVAHTLFGWAGRGLDCATKRDPTTMHRVFLPWEPDGYRTADTVVYYPVYKEFSNIPASVRDTIVWACKDVFVDEWPTDKAFHFGGAKVMRAIKRLEDNHGIKSVFINAECFETARAKRFGVQDIFTSLKKKEPYRGLAPRDVLEKAFSRARVSTVLHGYFSSAFIAPALGAIPLHFKDDSGTVWNPTGRLMDINASDEDFYSALEKVYVDDDYYNNLLEWSRKVVEKYENFYTEIICTEISKVMCKKLK